MTQQTGTTIQSVLPLERGSNAVVAVSGWTDAARATKLQMLAAQLAAMMGETPQFVGWVRDSAVYNIGQARPVYLRALPDNDRLQRWYQTVGEPVGPNREFWAVNIDWRGDAQRFQIPADAFVFPSAAKTVHGLHNWPDGTRDEQQARLKEEAANEELSSVATETRQAMANVAAAMPSRTTWITIAALTVGAISLWALATGKRID